MQTNLADFMRNTPDGEEADAILRKCVHCGFCTATCPTYQLLGDELDGPRGRIYLMKGALEGEGVWRRHHGEGAHPAGLAGGGDPAEHAAPVVAHQVEGLHLERLGQGQDVGHQVVHGVGRDRPGPGAGRIPALVRGDDLPAARVHAGRTLWLVDGAARADAP